MSKRSTSGVACTLIFYTILMVGFLAGCAGRPGPDVLQAMASPPFVAGTKQVKIYVATTRERSKTDDNVFTNGRATQMNFAEYTISIPPGHKAGNIEWPKSKPDPKTSFVTLSQRSLDRATFERELKQRSGAKKPDVAIFVHGFNTSFQEALFREAQLSADGASTTIPILFAWPSEASVAGYVADKDAVTFSRDSLVDLLTTVGRNPDFGEILVVAHSMGGWLTAEALRQLKLTGREAVLDRFKVVLAAPDIDVDVFTAQMAVIGPLPLPMTILVSQDDRALAVSSFISGDRQRIGTLDVSDPLVQSAATKANVQIVDISAVTTDDKFRHNRFSSLAALSPQLAAQTNNGTASNLRQAGAFVFNAVGATLSSPFVLAGKIVGGR